MAQKPDAVFYLRLGIEQLVPCVVFSRGFDYWESGMDLYPGYDMYDSFCAYQAALLAEFDRFSEEFKFETRNASAAPQSVFSHLKIKILCLLEMNPAAPLASMLASRAHTPAAREARLPCAAGKGAAAIDFDWAEGPTPARPGHSNGNIHGPV